MSENTVKFDIPEWVNWLARDRNGALFGYREKPMKCSTVFGASEAYTAGKPNLRFITSDPNHYPQVKWSDEEPKPFKDGITLLNPDELDEIHFYPSEEVSSGKSELDMNEAITALQNFGRYFNERVNEPTTFKDGITVTDIDVDDLTDEKGEKITIEDALRWGFKTVNQIREGEPDMIQNPPHYKQYTFEPIDIITEVVKEYPPEIGFHIGTVLKYLFRSPFKGKQLQDLEKAEYYLQRANKELGEVQ